MLNIVIFATCQGVAIEKFLMTNNDFSSNYNVTIIRNYEQIHYNKMIVDQFYNQLVNADVFIYQPLSDKYGRNSTEYIKTLLKNTCKTIAIPYVYNNSLWCFIPTLRGDTTDDWENRNGYDFIIKYSEIIDDLYAKGLNLNNILSLYDNNNIDFRYEERYISTMKNLFEKEQITDIKVHDFIVENIENKRLFLFCSHPTSPIYVHMTNQILNILGIQNIENNFSDDFASTGANIPIAHPTSAVNYFKFKFTTKEEEEIANNFYRNIIINHKK